MLSTQTIFTLFIILLILFILFSFQNYIPFVFNYKKQRDSRIDYNIDMFIKELEKNFRR